MANLLIRTDDEITGDGMADEAERIAGMLRDGFTSGEVMGGGWWRVEDLADDATASDDGEEA